MNILYQFMKKEIISNVVSVKLCLIKCLIWISIAPVHEGSFEHFLKSCPTRFSPKIVSREDFWILFKILSQRGSCPVRSCPTRSYCNPNFDCSKKLFCFFISLLLYFFPWHDLYKPYSYWGHFWAPTTKRGLAFPQFFS